MILISLLRHFKFSWLPYVLCITFCIGFYSYHTVKVNRLDAALNKANRAEIQCENSINLQNQAVLATRAAMLRAQEDQQKADKRAHTERLKYQAELKKYNDMKFSDNCEEAVKQGVDILSNQ